MLIVNLERNGFDYWGLPIFCVRLRLDTPISYSPCGCMNLVIWELSFPHTENILFCIWRREKKSTVAFVWTMEKLYENVVTRIWGAEKIAFICLFIGQDRFWSEVNNKISYMIVASNWLSAEAYNFLRTEKRKLCRFLPK